jgi:copper chaperone NosL
MALASCKPKFDPIAWGRDACAYCKMTIVDKHFAAEILTHKGKSFKFDDIACLRNYMKAENVKADDVDIYIADYANPDGEFINARNASYLRAGLLKSPMNGNTAAFPSADLASARKDSLHAESAAWKDL